jgi:hypothetical protein
VNEYLEKSDKAVSESVKHDITEHLRRLQISFEEYFPPNNNDNNWLRNPFIGSFHTDFSIKEYDQLIDTASDSVLKHPLFPFQVFGPA